MSPEYDDEWAGLGYTGAPRVIGLHRAEDAVDEGLDDGGDMVERERPVSRDTEKLG